MGNNDNTMIELDYFHKQVYCVCTREWTHSFICYPIHNATLLLSEKTVTQQNGRELR